jgi:hypothetical protein
MSKLSDYFVYYTKMVSGELKGTPPADKPLYDALEDLFLLTRRPGGTFEPIDSTFNLKER